jgi:type IV pilus assembly protein PilN
MQQTGGAASVAPVPAAAPAAADGKTPATPVATAMPTTSISLAGVARTYEDVNDFVLFLQRSPFFDSQQVRINEATISTFPMEVENKDQLPQNATLEIPDGIKYTISAQLKNVPSSQLKGEIVKKGSIGLATRLNTLERKGATLK